MHLTAELNMYEPFPDAPFTCPGIIDSGYLFPVTTKVKNNARSRPMVKVWAVPRSQLAWAIRHIKKNHRVRLANSKGLVAVIDINKGTDARNQFKLLFVRHFHTNFRWPTPFLF